MAPRAGPWPLMTSLDARRHFEHSGRPLGQMNHVIRSPHERMSAQGFPNWKSVPFLSFSPRFSMAPFTAVGVDISPTTLASPSPSSPYLLHRLKISPQVLPKHAENFLSRNPNWRAINGLMAPILPRRSPPYFIIEQLWRAGFGNRHLVVDSLDLFCARRSHLWR